MSGTRFSVSWDSHQKNICDGLSFLQQKGEFVDMTLAADGHHVQVHKMIMSLVSPYIKDIITSTQCAHPVIFLHNMSYSTLQSILEYVYTGEVMVPKDDIRYFLDACKSLQIKGLDNAHSSLSDSTPHYPVITSQEQYEDVMENTPQIKKQFKEDKSNISLDLPSFHDDSQPLSPSNDFIEYDNDDVDDWSFKENPTTNKTAKTKEPDSQVVQYTVSNQGNLQIILNRYVYGLRYRRQNKNCIWICSSARDQKCPAVLVTRDNKIVRRQRAHNHPYHDKKILKCVKAAKVFSLLSEAEDRSIEMKGNK